MVSTSTREAWNEHFYTLHFLAFALSLAGSHVGNMNASANASARKWKFLNPLLASALVLALRLLTRAFTCALVLVLTFAPLGKKRCLKSACVYCHNLIFTLVGEKKYMFGDWSSNITLIQE